MYTYAHTHTPSDSSFDSPRSYPNCEDVYSTEPQQIPVPCPHQKAKGGTLNGDPYSLMGHIMDK